MPVAPEETPLTFTTPAGQCVRRVVSAVFIFGLILTFYYFPGFEMDIGPSKPDPDFDRWLFWFSCYLPLFCLWICLLVPVWASRDMPQGKPVQVRRRIQIQKAVLTIPALLWLTPCAGCMCLNMMPNTSASPTSIVPFLILLGGLVFWGGMGWQASYLIERRWLRLEAGDKQCRQCGYELSSQADRRRETCPDCGGQFRASYLYTPYEYVDSNWPRWTLDAQRWRYWSYAMVVISLLMIGGQPDLLIYMFRVSSDDLWLQHPQWAMLVTGFSIVMVMWFTVTRSWLKLNHWQREQYRSTQEEFWGVAHCGELAIGSWFVMLIFWLTCLSPVGYLSDLTAGVAGDLNNSVDTTPGWHLLLFTLWMTATLAWMILSVIQLRKRLAYHSHAMSLCYSCGFGLAPHQAGRCPSCDIEIPYVPPSTDVSAEPSTPS